MAMEFKVSPEVEKRILALIESVKAGKTKPMQAVDIMMQVFAGIMGGYQRTPEEEQAFQALVGRKIAQEVPGVVTVTGTLQADGGLKVEEGAAEDTPKIVIESLDALGELMTGKTDMMAAFMAGKIQVSSISELMELMGPVATALQDEERRAGLQKMVEGLVDQALKKHGF